MRRRAWLFRCSFHSSDVLKSCGVQCAEGQGQNWKNDQTYEPAQREFAPAFYGGAYAFYSFLDDPASWKLDWDQLLP